MLGLPVSISPYGLCGRKAIFDRDFRPSPPPPRPSPPFPQPPPHPTPPLLSNLQRQQLRTSLAEQRDILSKQKAARSRDRKTMPTNGYANKSLASDHRWVQPNASRQQRDRPRTAAPSRCTSAAALWEDAQHRRRWWRHRLSGDDDDDEHKPQDTLRVRASLSDSFLRTLPELVTSIAFWHLPPNSARIGYEHRFLAPSSKLCQNWLRASLSGTSLQTLPQLVTSITFRHLPPNSARNWLRP